jgi:hypothetical protein
LIIALTCGIAVVVIAFILGVRAKDLPAPEPVSPFRHLDERKASIYENLRDLQFEYRVGKLSDADYQSTKKDLQKELAAGWLSGCAQGTVAGAGGAGSGPARCAGGKQPTNRSRPGLSVLRHEIRKAAQILWRMRETDEGD